MWIDYMIARTAHLNEKRRWHWPYHCSNSTYNCSRGCLIKGISKKLGSFEEIKRKSGITEFILKHNSNEAHTICLLALLFTPFIVLFISCYSQILLLAFNFQLFLYCNFFSLNIYVWYILNDRIQYIPCL